VRVPESVLIRIRGARPENVAAKDFMLEILRQPYVRNGEAIGKIVEYG
jgi:3-isopropylmalate/(R)-2-methylmalate dehydratase large subunit